MIIPLNLRTCRQSKAGDDGAVLSLNVIMDQHPTVQGWILQYKDFWENFHISGFLCYKFIVLLSDFTLSIWFVTSEIKE